MMIRSNRRGFTLVEIMIVVAIIGLLAAIAIPNFVKAREKALTNACIANLKQIQGAIQVWAIDKGAAGTATCYGVTGGDATTRLVPDYIKAWPHCGGTAAADAYADTQTVDGTPVCPHTTTGHTL